MDIGSDIQLDARHWHSVSDSSIGTDTDVGGAHISDTSPSGNSPPRHLHSSGRAIELANQSRGLRIVKNPNQISGTIFPLSLTVPPSENLSVSNRLSSSRARRKLPAPESGVKLTSSAHLRSTSWPLYLFQLCAFISFRIEHVLFFNRIFFVELIVQPF